MPEKEPGWRKPTLSAEGNCVEVNLGFDPNPVRVRDSKNRKNAVLGFSRTAWASFITALKNDELTN